MYRTSKKKRAFGIVTFLIFLLHISLSGIGITQPYHHSSNLAKMAYSGSPYPIAKGENGPRKVFLIDVTNGEIIAEPVDIPGVPYRDTVSFFFVPGSEGLVLEEIKAYLEVKANPSVILDISVGGYLENIIERELLSEIGAIITKHRDGWKNIYLGTQRFLGMGRLPGLARKCLQLFNEIEPPSFYDIDNLARDPVLKELAQKVLSEEKEAIRREALEYMLPASREEWDRCGFLSLIVNQLDL